MFSVVYVYFFQGGGWNQNSHFDTVRAIVEEARVEITSFASNTGDIGVFKGRVYSNKPPGVAYFGSAIYLILYYAESAWGIFPQAPILVTINAHIVTFVTSGLPAVGVLAFLYLAWRREGATVRESLSLAAMFGTGSLILPYAGVMTNHTLGAFLLFGAWFLITSPSRAPWPVFAGGVLTGGAIFVDFLAAPVAVLYAAYVLWFRVRVRDLTGFLVGAAIFSGMLLIHNYLAFEHPFVTNYAIRAQSFRQEELLFGMFGWPEPMRLLWLTVHPFRGIFYCCPVLLISILSLRWPLRLGMTFPARHGVALGVVFYFLVFALTFGSWTGGWGVGPRYLIPALPFFFFFALRGFRRFPILAVVLSVLSIVAMVAVTAVQVMVPAPNFGGPPPGEDPVLYCVRQLLSGRVSISTQSMLERQPALSGRDDWDSYNLGEVLGLPGLWSLLPLVVLGAVGLLLGAALVHDEQHGAARRSGECGSVH